MDDKSQFLEWSPCLSNRYTTYLRYVKVKRIWQFVEITSSIREIICHMGSHSVTCHPAAVLIQLTAIEIEIAKQLENKFQLNWNWYRNLKMLQKCNWNRNSLLENMENWRIMCSVAHFESLYQLSHHCHHLHKIYWPTGITGLCGTCVVFSVWSSHFRKEKSSLQETSQQSVSESKQ